MRLLVLGGTVFVGKAVALEAVRRGHEVVCAARGASGTVPDGAALVPVDRDRPGSLSALDRARFDAVVDVATISYPWVADALNALADRAGHWTFVSSVSAYADMVPLGQKPGSPVLEPRTEQVASGTPSDPKLYGAIKVASENAVRDRFGESAFVVRPGLITGPGDPSDRFGYWPARMAQGGRVLVPDAPELSTQYIDVRDLANWILDAAEQRIGGTFDAICRPEPLPRLLAGIAEAVGSAVELVPMAEQALIDAGVEPWSGKRSLPLWLPADHVGMAAHDPTESIAAGLRPRPLPEAVAGALAHERQLGLDRDRKAGLTRAEEAELLGAR